ncbi:MAG: hypothetical protein KDE53_30550, partial [Caldilineaceae bacterium]|nr:hypothetical protein [Caldilineaceae bacterium]
MQVDPIVIARAHQSKNRGTVMSRCPANLERDLCNNWVRFCHLSLQFLVNPGVNQVRKTVCFPMVAGFIYRRGVYAAMYWVLLAFQ